MKQQNSNIAILTALLRAQNTSFEHHFAYDKQGQVFVFYQIGGLTNIQRMAFNRINQTLTNKAQSEIKAEGFAIVKQLRYMNRPTEGNWLYFGITPPLTPGRVWSLVYIEEFIFEEGDAPLQL